MTTILFLILLPAAAAFAIYFAGGRTPAAKALILLTALAHGGLTLLVCLMPSLRNTDGLWLGLDQTALTVLAVTSVLFLAVTIHTLCWIPADTAYAHSHSHILLFGKPVFLSALAAFLSTMTLVITARNFGLLWVAVEATTLVSAPLICYHLSDRSLEAMWKYLLICSVGIGLALFGTMTLAVAAHPAGVHGLNMAELAGSKELFHTGWFKAAFIFILVGYGTKMGLAPFHTWLPDAHSEAPGSISALLSGALLNCSFLGIIRFTEIMPEELRQFQSGLLIFLGLFSLITAAFFIIRQTDFKRMLAYSSVEHMGLLALLWGAGQYNASLIHLCGHSLIKMSLFLLAGNILLAYGTRTISHVSGIFHTLPKNAILWLTGVLLICGTPPSPLFVTEFILVRSAPLWLGLTVLALLFVIFAGMSMAVLNMCMGSSSKSIDTVRFRRTERLAWVPMTAVAAAIAGGTVLTLILNRGGL